MKNWMQKIMDQLEFDWSSSSLEETKGKEISEELGTILYLIDNYNKYLFEVDGHPIRKTREKFDEFAKLIVSNKDDNIDKALFRFRQFFSSYRIDETTYIQKSMDEFKNIIWDLVDQLNDEFDYAKTDDEEVKHSFELLQDAVESDSIEMLKANSRKFVDSYIEFQTRKDTHTEKSISKMQHKLDSFKSKLVEANNSMRLDHLTKAYNRMSFDEQIAQVHKLYSTTGMPVSLVALDIDHFKKFNDTYGHAIGDFILVECVKILQSIYADDGEFVARTGGEEFMVIMPGKNLKVAEAVAQKLLEKVRSEVFIQDQHKLSFLISMGIAELQDGEAVEEWIKRSDDALYESKNTGRNKYTISNSNVKLKSA